ncbi:MAG: hotdog fold thioesterase [Candidatus Omnitrophica bacterium]|nr:hotdog fold thioesterase [Candidatus Omnitrophota bacterium]
MELSVLKDRFAKHLQIEILERRPGYAKVGLKLREELLNGLRFAHGGVIFTVADYAFALASNTENETALGIHADIHFIKAAAMGDELIAEVSEVSRSRRLGVYRGTVTSAKGDILAQIQTMGYLQKMKDVGAKV